ncbi:MAG: GNAT family N-acetyltransferase [Pseudomonadota bacterium]
MVSPLRGAALFGILDKVAALRIEVFRAYPYLYEGDVAYEKDYLSDFASAPGAIVVGAFEGERLVGAATGAAMSGQHAEFQQPFLERGDDLDTLFYCGESVLLPKFRGRGIGHAFFDYREQQARSLGATQSCFCAVVRPPVHPLRPPEYRPLDPFWRKRGYKPLPGTTATFSWREIGQEEESNHEMQFWGRSL